MPASLDVLAKDLENADEQTRADAAEQLCHLGEKAQAVAVPLVRATGDSSEEVAEWAVGALEELGPPRGEDVDGLAGLLDQDSPDVGYWAATLLARLGPEAAPATDRLAAMLTSGADNAVKQQAAKALGKIGPAAASALPQLQAADDGDPRLARLAKDAVARISS